MPPADPSIDHIAFSTPSDGARGGPVRGGGDAIDVLSLSVAGGIVAGVLDVLSLEARRLWVEPIVFIGHHTPWTAPLATVALFVPVAIGILVLSRLIRQPQLAWAATLWSCTFLGTFGALYTFPQIQRLAALILSAGIATVVTRRWSHPGNAGRRGIRRAALATSGLLVIAGALFVWRDVRREQRSVGDTAPEGAPNVLLLVLDTVRAISMSLYGYERETTPQLAAWGKRGVVFEQAYSTAPWTLPSHASMMTGRWMHELSTDWMVPLDARDATLAEVLSRAGYRTGGFVANTDYTSAEVGLDRGFGHFEDYTLNASQLLRSSSLWRALARIEVLRRVIGNHDNLGRRTAPDITHAFRAWAARDTTRPYFAFLNYYDAHRPYFPPGAWAAKFQTPGTPLNTRYRKENGQVPNPTPAQVQGAIDAYDGAIAYLDDQLGALLRELESSGELRRTIVVITADHGEEFFEHRLWDHGNSLYAPSVHVPLIVLAPGRVPEGVRVPSPVSARSIPATIMDLLPFRPATTFPGRSLQAVWRDSTVQDSIFLGVREVQRQPERYPVSVGNLGGVVAGTAQYIRNFGNDAEELYDGARDPWQHEDLSRRSEWAEARLRLRALSDSIFPARRR
ncbi:MAG: sulfatase-like hydrolase/transferase [Gemmatimonadaceae bacterium]|nr:sulfatase-like hydrolase/transferase [Gemmatimonadaceae bacterium]